MFSILLLLVIFLLAYKVAPREKAEHAHKHGAGQIALLAALPLQLLAYHLSQANARSQQRARELAGQVEISQAFGALDNPQTTYAEVTRRLAQVFGVQGAVVLLFDSVTGTMHAQVPSFGVPPERLSGTHYQLGNEARAIWDPYREPVWIMNELRASAPPGVRYLAARFRSRQWIAAAMFGQGGLIGVLYTMASWWGDVIKEAQYKGDHTRVVQISHRYGMILFIASEVMFFVAWFWAFFNSALFPDDAVHIVRDQLFGGHWPPKGIETFDPWHLPLLNTLILLTSGTTVTWAHHALLEDDRQGLKWGLILTILLGLTFTCVQAYEYSHAHFHFSGNIYGATFFMATGFHGAHVIIGSIFLIVCLLRALAGHFTPKQHLGFEFAAWYWHFVDVVWLFLFACIYVWGAGVPHPE